MKAICLFLVFLVISGMGIAQSTDKQNKICLVVHGGAGAFMRDSSNAEREAQCLEKLKEALLKGYAILKSGGSSTEAVVSTVKILEDSPLFNAGKGSVFTHSGTHEMDASLMEGHTLRAGAVCGVRKLRNPVLAAQAVMDRTQHVLLSGSEADMFGESCGLLTAPAEYFFEEKPWQHLQKLKKMEAEQWEDPDKGQLHSEDSKFGTVGALALDVNGHLSAATSTGGMSNKKYGRIGDSPIIGAGNYANHLVAVSCTGHGEYFIRNVVAYDVYARMRYLGESVKTASETIIHQTLSPQGGEGGLIALDAEGNISMPFNTGGMYRGYIRSNGDIHVELY